MADGTPGSARTLARMASGSGTTVDDRRQQRRVVRWVVLGLVVIAVILLIWTVIAAVAAKSRLTAARNDLDNLRQYSQVDRQDIESRLQHDLSRSRQAKGWLHQLGPSVAGSIPLLGRSIVAERTVADASAAAVDAGLAASRDTDTIGTTGAINLAALAKARADLATHAAEMREPLQRLAVLRTSLTPSPIGKGVHQAQDALLGLDTDLQRAADFTDVLGGLLGAHGPRTFLVALQNNAELRGTGGLISTFALGTARDGRLDIGKFQDVDTYAAPPSEAKPVAAPADYRQNYGPYLANTTLWKDVNFDPDAPTSAQVLSEIAALTTRHHADVVVMLDVPAMADIVGATGSITLANGQKLGKDALTAALLVDAYSSHADTIAGQTQRRLQLEDAASRSLHRLTSAHPSLKLVRTLANLAAGRHVALWSANPSEERELVDVGVAGSVVAHGNDTAMASMVNLGDSLSRALGHTGSGNKLDYYGHRSLDLDVTVGPHSARVVETLTVRNETPLESANGEPLPRYVTGPNHPGRMHELISFTAAADATIESLTLDGRSSQLATFDNEHGYRRVSFVSDLERGQESTWVLTYDVPLPDGIYRLDVIPQPLAKPATLRVTVTADPGHQLDGLPGEGVRPHDGIVDVSGPWATTQHIAVTLHQRHGWAAFRHAVADFFTKPISN
jgi:hypothetical protein